MDKINFPDDFKERIKDLEKELESALVSRRKGLGEENRRVIDVLMKDKKLMEQMETVVFTIAYDFSHADDGRLKKMWVNIFGRPSDPTTHLRSCERCRYAFAIIRKELMSFDE